jgi:hypothetical protein
MELLQIKAIEANPELLETYKLLVWFLGVLLGFSVSVVIFFIKREVFPNKTTRDEKKEYEELKNKKSDDQTGCDYKSDLEKYTELQNERWHDFEQRQQDFNNDRKEQITTLENMIKEVCSNVQGINTVMEVIKRLDEERYPRLEKNFYELSRKVSSQGDELIYIKAYVRSKLGNGFNKDKFGEA